MPCSAINTVAGVPPSQNRYFTPQNQVQHHHAAMHNEIYPLNLINTTYLIILLVYSVPLVRRTTPQNPWQMAARRSSGQQKSTWANTQVLLQCERSGGYRN
jgi:hypothetical protein